MFINFARFFSNMLRDRDRDVTICLFLSVSPLHVFEHCDISMPFPVVMDIAQLSDAQLRDELKQYGIVVGTL